MRRLADDMQMKKDEEIIGTKQAEEMLSQIENSVEDLKVPESLEPDAVKKKLKAVKKKRSVRKYTEIAAAAALVAVIGGAGIYQKINTIPAEQHNLRENIEQTIDTLDNLKEVVLQDTRRRKTEHVGDYHLAKNYAGVYSAIRQMRKDYEEQEKMAYSELERGDIQDLYFNSVVKEGMTDGMAVQKAETVSENFSKTNTQVEGVDESDFIKNDGRYLYIQTNRRIRVVDIQGEKMVPVADIEPDMKESDLIQDIYVDGNQLYLVLQRREECGDEELQVRSKRMMESTDLAISDCIYNYNTDTTMELKTYDITDKNQIRYLGAVTQDGTYVESRKVGDFIYLFSRKSCSPNQLFNEDTALTDEEVLQELIPKINGEMVSCDCIYMQEKINNEYIVSSVNIHKPSLTVDHMVVMEDSYTQLHMGKDAIYFYETDYAYGIGNFLESRAEEGERTHITKFSYEDGYLNGVGEASVKGSINDTFAISESNGILRVLTTERIWEGEGSDNRLYLLDENLNQLSCLEGIARGEEVYAARFIGNVAYFITYHNTDPLFAVDISDPRNPVILGQVEITGFSDYLHPFGEGLLLGIGYETDPVTSQRLGVKLVMFDISDPTRPEIKDFAVIKGTYSGTAENYKGVFVNVEKGLIGFDVNDWSAEEGNNLYKVFRWTAEGGFAEEMSAPMQNCCNSWKTRGLYAGNTFYVVFQRDGDQYVIRSYDMERGFEAVDEMETALN